MNSSTQAIIEAKSVTPINPDTKGRRVTIDLTSAAASEVDRLRIVTGLTHGRRIPLRIDSGSYLCRCKAAGHELQIVDPSGNERDVRIELPVQIAGPVKE